jgi:NAD(P)-dependent dehydrogenase (short-subunit alcohol dehydrogenase family)
VSALAGQTVVVIGGSSGIGLETARHARAEEADVILTARDLHLVMGPVSRGSSVRFRVFLDGHPVGAAHGADIDEQGYGTVTEQRLYQLIRQPPPIIDRQFESEFLDAGVEAFALTFG